jgi:hypothetical protein
VIRPLLAGEARRPRGNGKAGDPQPARAAVPIAQGNGPVGHQLDHAHIGEGSGHRKQSRIVLDDPADGLRGRDLKPPGLAQQHEAKRVIQLGVGQDNAFDRHMADARGGRTREPPELVPDIGRGVEQEPPVAVRTDRGRRLAARHGARRIAPRDPAGRAPAVPLGKATAGRCTEENDLHAWGRDGAEKTEGPAFASPSDQHFALERRDVGGDFHRDGNDFGLGLGPLHDRFLQRFEEGPVWPD